MRIPSQALKKASMYFHSDFIKEKLHFGTFFRGLKKIKKSKLKNYQKNQKYSSEN